MTDKDKQRLIGVHPELIKDVDFIVSQLPMKVTMGVRTLVEQQAIYALGRTKPGKIVTMKDGIIHPSNHQVASDGFGHAVDLAFTGPNPFSSNHDWEKYGQLVESRGRVWGGRWTHPHDSPHMEMKA